MFKIEKEIKWEGSHRLMSSFAKECQMLHGHSYRAIIIIESLQLNEDGMVVDFKKLKQILTPYVDAVDHRTMLHKDDDVVQIPEADCIRVDFNPTAENMAMDLHRHINDHVGALGLQMQMGSSLEVKIYETVTGCASFRGALQ